MKKLILTLAVLTAWAPFAKAQEVKNLEVVRQGKWLSVKMDIEMKGLFPGSNEAVIIAPEIKKGQDSTQLKPVSLYSRNQWYYYKRSGRTASGKEEISIRRADIPATLNYEAVTPYCSWMDGADLYLGKTIRGCVGCEKQERQSTFLALVQDTPERDTVLVENIVYVRDTIVIREPVGVRSLAGRAFVGFPVNETAIDPQYQSNTAELGKLRASIDSVRSSAGAVIRKIWIKGYASPDGKYDINARLARERTKAVKRYVASLYNIPEDIFEIEWVAENWEGLRSFVETSSLPHRTGILEIIDGARLPDDKEWMIKSRYPDDWKAIQEQCLPLLRRTDYRIDYDITENNNNQ